MATPRILHTFRNLQRLREIVGVLARHGFGHLIHRIGLGYLLPVRRRLKERVPAGAATGSAGARRVVAALQDLGPTFVKLGQMLANRPDIVPPTWIEELRTLHDRVAPFDTDQALARIAEELGAPVGKLFKDFDRTPFAAGSLAQCYHATSAEGEPLVIKVKRPGIERTIFMDLELLETLARLTERHVPELRLYRPAVIAEELAATMKRELDFLNEASNTERFRLDLASSEDLRQVGVPRVFWSCTTRNVLTTERLGGENLLTLLERPDHAVDRKALARLICSTYMHQFFVTGFFHADPHPGNLLVTAPARLNLIDFGMVGHLTEHMKDQLGTVVLALVSNNLDVLTDVFLEIGSVGVETHPEDLNLELLRLLDKYYGLPAGRLDFAQVFAEFSDAARRHRALLPREFVLMGRAFVTVVSLAMRLDPDLKVDEVVRPYARRLVLGKVSPRALTKRFWTTWRYLGSLVTTMPRDLRDFARRAARGDLQLTVQHRRLDDLIGEIDRSSNRLAFAITTAAIIIGSSMLINSRAGPAGPFGLPLLGLVGYVIAGVMGLWLLIAILRSGRL